MEKIFLHFMHCIYSNIYTESYIKKNPYVHKVEGLLYKGNYTQCNDIILSIGAKWETYLLAFTSLFHIYYFLWSTFP